MLVIRRRAGQAIVVGDNIEIQVTEIEAGRVKLAISAPREIAVLRKEVKLTREQNLAAARSLPVDRLVQLTGRLCAGAKA